eukprot:1152131-Pelagomonas_calceolata.AAC.1
MAFAFCTCCYLHLLDWQALPLQPQDLQWICVAKAAPAACVSTGHQAAYRTAFSAAQGTAYRTAQRTASEHSLQNLPA